MMKPPIPANEQERLATLRALKILDSSAEERYDRLTRMAQRLFSVPMAAITLIDENRQWLKSKQGLEAVETSRDVAFCAHTINGNDVMVVNDATTDNRFMDNPFVTGEPNIRFYAGYPIEAPNHTKMGALCLLDKKPRNLTGVELALLQNLGRLVENEMCSESTEFADEISGKAEERFFLRVLRYVMEFSRDMNYPMGMLVVYVPPAFSINDKSPIVYDRVLVEVAKILGKSVRTSDVVGSLGDDSFYAFFPKCDDYGMNQVMNRVNFNLKDMKSRLSCSADYKLGLQKLIWNPKDKDTVDDLVNKGLTLLEQSRLASVKK